EECVRSTTGSGTTRSSPPIGRGRGARAASSASLAAPTADLRPVVQVGAAMRALVVFDVLVVDETAAFDAHPVEPAGGVTHATDRTDGVLLCNRWTKNASPSSSTTRTWPSAHGIRSGACNSTSAPSPTPWPSGGE